jgi:hypothetical protein
MATEEDLERLCGPGGVIFGSLYRPKSFYEEEDESAPEAEPVDGEEDDSDS